MGKKIDIEIPQELDDITLEKWQEFFPVTQVKDVAENTILRKMLKVFFGINQRDFAKMKMSDIEMLANKVSELVEKKPSLVQRFFLHGVEYGLIPNFDDMTFGEFIDLDNYSGIDKLHLQMSVLFRKVVNNKGKNYLIEPYAGSHDKFKEMPLGVVLGVQGFFLTIAKELMKDMMKSSHKEHPQQMKKALAESGVGMPQLIRSLEETFSTLTGLRR